MQRDTRRHGSIMRPAATGRATRAKEAYGDDAGGAGGRRIERRLGLPSSRALIGGLLMALAAVGTFVAYAGAGADDSVDVLIAGHDLRPGQTLTADDVDVVPVDVPGEVRGLFGSVGAAVGRQVVAPVDAGEFVQASATVAATEGAEALEVAVALPASRAVGGLHPGERVDVFSTWGGSVTELVAVDARVLEVRGASGSGALAGGDLVTVRLSLADFDQVEAIVHAQAAGDITMVRAAIGTSVQDVGREYRPLAGRVTGSGDGAATESAER